MKKYILLFSLFIVVLSSCKKAETFDPAAQAVIDDAAIQAYIKSYNINATKDPSGLYYSIITPGTGPYPTATSNIAVNYTGTLLNGTTFDTQPSVAFSLAPGGVIKGWQIGLPHINKGGTIMLIVPSALAYGDAATGSIPANSVLIFSITLQGFN
jgi:FKBP-type peptidyl-prolyl cis-trans isomerase FkpA